MIGSLVKDARLCVRIGTGRRRLEWRIICDVVRAGRIAEFVRARRPFAHEPTRPTTVSIELTDVCQLQCPYCTAQNAMRRPPGFMSEETFGNLLMQLKALQPRNLRIIGGGEPTLHRRFATWVPELAQTAVFRSVTTNGQCLSDDVCIAALSSLTVVEISVDSDHAAGYERSRVGGKLETLIENIQRLRRFKKQMCSHTMIHIRVMIRPSEEAAQRRILAFWSPLADILSTQLLIDYVGGSEDLYPLTKRTDVPRCAAPFTLLGVHWNGDVPLCDASADQMGVPEGLILGNLNRQTLASIWQSPIISQYRRGHKACQAEHTPICAGCTDARYPRLKGKQYNTPAGGAKGGGTIFRVLK